MDMSKFEIDAKLLEQFSCLGTDDKDDLINAFQRVIGTDISADCSRFFLELANWNLQNAIGAYFDYSFETQPATTTTIAPATSTQTNTTNQTFLPQASLYDAKVHQTPYSGLKLTPPLVWCVQNTGTASWPENSYITAETDPAVATSATCDMESMVWLPHHPDTKTPIVSLPPGSFAHLSIDILPPSDDICVRALSANVPVVGALRLALPNGNRFGEPLYCTAIPDVASRSIVFRVGTPSMTPPPPELSFQILLEPSTDNSRQAMDEDL